MNRRREGGRPAGKAAYLILGGGHGQLGLIRRTREKGIRVILQDRNPRCPGAPLADDFVEADTVDERAAADAARRFRVDAVITAGTDQPVLAASRAAAARGCPSFLSEETALAVTDKEAMKKALSGAGIPMPRCRFASPGDGPSLFRDLRLPWVVKPVDSQGQRGVLRVDSADAFPAARDEALAWSRRRRIVVEEFRPNREITVSGWVRRGRARIWTVTDRVTKDFLPHIGLCLAHRFPSAYASGRPGEAEKLARECTAALGIGEGPLYYQFLVTEEGLLVNETAARLGGAYEEISLPPVCGADPVELLVGGAARGGADPDEAAFLRPRVAAAFAVPLMFCRPGTVSALGSERAVRALPGVTAFEYLLGPGTVVHPAENSVQRAAYMVVHGADAASVNSTLRRAMPRAAVRGAGGRRLLRDTLGYTLIPMR